MPLTHIEVEQRKTGNLIGLFASLLLVYLVSLYALALVWHWFGASGPYLWFVRKENLWPSAEDCLVVFFFSLVFGWLHWEFSVDNLFNRTLEAIRAVPINESDAYHVRLKNTIEEVSVAMGGKAIEAYVIATPAVNACAVSDFANRSAIAVTEGALAWLSREQLESVIGHEAAHIANGDSLTDSVFCSLFALHEEALKHVSGVFDPESPKANAVPYAIVLYVILQVTHFLKLCCSFAISRQKEYRADAVAVQLTRNPLALADALRLISKKWHGVGMVGDSLSSLFIVDSGVNDYSEQEGMLADWFATHPPIHRRIEALAGMAGSVAGVAAHSVTDGPLRQPAAPIIAPRDQEHGGETNRWTIWDGAAWAGPLSLAELAHHPLLKPETWVRLNGGANARPAQHDPALLKLFNERYVAQQAAQTLTCPNCSVGLLAKEYEGAHIDKCPSCGGCYVDSENMVKIFTRQIAAIPEPVQRLGDVLLTGKGIRLAKQQMMNKRSPTAKLRTCPRCEAAVIQKFYTEAYPVEVEQCWECAFTWLDKFELELLQYIYEKRSRWHDEDNDAPAADAPPAA